MYLTLIKNTKRIDDYYLSIMNLLYNIYNILHINNPELILQNKKITYNLLKIKNKTMKNTRQNFYTNNLKYR